jgi:hypothetical protein
VPPTDTPVPTATPLPPTNTPVPTATSVPPTSTPTEEAVSSIFQSGGESGTFREAASATPTRTAIPTETPIASETPLPTETGVPTEISTQESVDQSPVEIEVSTAEPQEEATEVEEEETEEATEEETEEPEDEEDDEDRDRYVDSDQVDRFEELREQALAGESLYGPVSGDLVEGVGVIQGIYPEIVTANSYVRATFTNPDDLGTPYDIGFGIRHVEGNNQLRLVISTNDEWFLGIGDGAAYQVGKAHGFQSEPGEQNTVEIVADGNTGYLAINGTLVAILDLSPSSAAGDVWVAAGLNVPDIVTGRTSVVTDFQIWALP